MKPNELEQRLKAFPPTQIRYRFKTGLLITPGIKFLIDTQSADWLVSLIANAQFQAAIRDSSQLRQFQSWELSTTGTPYLHCFMNLEQQTHPTLSIPLWDSGFPLKFLRLLVVEGVLMLLSESAD